MHVIQGRLEVALKAKNEVERLLVAKVMDSIVHACMPWHSIERLLVAKVGMMKHGSLVVIDPYLHNTTHSLELHQVCYTKTQFT